ncbi:MAG TPA: molybdate ABC transporter substrate-binding protein, partial [Gammaproteobacteria bacterium]|nr:molybdate ABC transporter substrate-binding protein [Gammaproteobacteria bacterium]
LASLDYKFLSLANPDAVPAGRYAREWLQSISLGDSTLWAAVKHRVAPGPDVRAALGLVEADPQIIGIVYRTDATISDRVKVLYSVPIDRGPPIRYAVALVANRPHTQASEQFLRFLGSLQAREIFTHAGFVPLNPQKEQTSE